MINDGFRRKKVLVSGGLGFIGSNLVRKLVDNGSLVIIADSFYSYHGANYFNINGYRDKVEVHILDVRSPEFLELLHGVDFYFNLAAQSSHLSSLLKPIEDIDINTRAQLAMLEYCRLHNPNIRIIFTSTRQVYGKTTELPAKENHPIRPVDINGVDKAATEHYLRLYHQIYGLNTISLRLTNTFGPRMRINGLYLPFLGNWIKSLFDSNSIELWDENIVRDFTYIDDVIDALIGIGCHEQAFGEVFNLGGEISTLGNVARVLIELWGTGEIIVTNYPEDRIKIEIGNIYTNYQKIQALTGWQPKISLENGLAATLDYYRENIREYC
ncbi:MAG: NAD-dependent epimerase/dehydratase family protein [Anaerolineales bacterium]|nr:NAD-dependent epimerase/dehydratase family protein [Anaerolineales bacterium]